MAKNGSTLELTVGSLLVVPGWGIGRVSGWQELDIDGERVETVQVEMRNDDGRAWFPRDALAEQGVRPVMTEARVEQTWKVIRTQEAPKRRKHWNQRQRRYNEALASNRPKAMAEILGELAAVRREKKLTFTEKRIFRKLRKLLTAELAAARGVSQDIIDEKMERVLSPEEDVAEAAK